MNVREIAKLANVSIATVSRVVNRPEVVQPETRAHVLTVMRAHNYNPASRGTAARTGSICLLAGHAGDYLVQRLLSGVENVAAQRDCSVYLCGTGGRSEEDLLRAVVGQRFDGLIICSSSLGAESAARLVNAHMPFVLAGRCPAAAHFNACYVNFEEGAYRMARHLLELGRKRLWLLTNGRRPNVSASMQEGLLRAQRMAGLEPDGGRVLHAPENSVHAGYEAAFEVLSGSLPDAVFASGDELAFGFMKALLEHGVDVPGEVAVTGFTDSPTAGIVTPELTTVEQPAHRQGMVAARMLFDMIDGIPAADATPQEIVLLPKLKIRASCGNRRHINTLFE
ncbi:MULTISPECIES: LacI family DNA-binding transcriptional regulator [Anaerotruncus]|uniref:LacI family transcriptional regulator n=1 Tax=Anaerotruncus colihominis TaxID=169435 RepID=A0A845RHJ6_9FIRM|nr:MULTISPECIES: LacI family DNA-binding transcriptional regulator [Anaerotruncus]MCI8493321.1 LacI family transcriptional regulator [Anaerotruncus sp.]MCR2026492.1 LacI family transcriptional regulator [Anaerotruncus colihominis]NBI79073.1 LacI family transcriptional regulator [Anaerotruncus colihominis]NDO40799.1 LacI family transcriptional regulator [Anaerotruncus colihominis]